MHYHRHHRRCGRHRHHTLRPPNHPQPTPTTATIAAIATPFVRCIEIIKNSPSVKTLDITGGAPEMNDQFRPIVEAASAARPDIEIIDRCNLTVLAEPGHEDLPEFLAKHKVGSLLATVHCSPRMRTRGGGSVCVFA